MAQAHTIATTFSRSGETYQITKELTDEQEIAMDVTVPASTTHMQAAIAFDKDRLTSVFISSDVQVTLKTNSTGTPDNTLTVKVGTPIKWTSEDPSANNPFAAADVTTFYLTNATAGAASVKIRILWNSTP